MKKSPPIQASLADGARLAPITNAVAGLRRLQVNNVPEAKRVIASALTGATATTASDPEKMASHIAWCLGLDHLFDRIQLAADLCGVDLPDNTVTIPGQAEA